MIFEADGQSLVLVIVQRARDGSQARSGTLL